MKGSEIIEKIGVSQIHCSVEKEMIELDPEHDYTIIRGTENSPRVVCDHHAEMIMKGKYPRLSIEDGQVVSDVEWTTGHNAFEGEVEPKRIPKRDKTYMIQ